MEKNIKENTKHGLTIRSDAVYCPLPISYDSYFNCLTNCYHCYFRRLNHIWGKELKPSNPEALKKKLLNGLKNKNPKSVLARCLSQKKTIRIGNKADPYQKIELKRKVTQKAIKVFAELKWSVVIQTRFTGNMLELNEEDLSGQKELVTLMPVISPGLNKDWELLERKRTTPPEDRLKHITSVKDVNIGVNGEPFIPGWHTIKDFRNALKLLKKHGIKSYNTYNFHFNDYVAKKLHAHTPLDIEKIWYHNQDEQWKKILVKLLDLAKKYDIKLGCPDFVNSGKDYHEPANTCCGINVPNPCTFNSHNFKIQIQENEGLTSQEIFKRTWDGSGDKKKGLEVIRGKSTEFYTLKDAGFDIK